MFISCSTAHVLVGRRASAAIAIAILASSAPLSAQSGGGTMPDSVRQYVAAAMTTFRAHSVHQAEVDWPALQDSVLSRAASAQTPADTHRALTWALRRVDVHSFLMPPARVMNAAAFPQPSSGPPAGPTGRVVERGVALITVPTHAGRNRTPYVDSLHAQLARLDSSATCGWVVDLRTNGGGNMWPMLAGVGPLLGAEVVGSMSNAPSGRAWRYRDGRSWNGDSAMPAEPAGWGSAPPRSMANARRPVAVLLGRETASSGEMTLLAFLGRPDTRTFGDSTGGRNSVNSSILLSDSATMVVTSGYPRDRLGRTYGLTVGPDELVVQDRAATGDAALLRAVAWLHQQPRCSERR